MKLIRICALVVALPAGVAAFAFAQSSNPWLGTWKVNLEKSTYDPGPKPPTAQTVKIEAIEGGLKMSFNGVEGSGNHLDGKDYPNPTDSAPNQPHRFRRVDGRTFERSVKANGKDVSFTARWAASADGKTITVTQKGKNPQGQTVSNVIVYDRQ